MDSNKIYKIVIVYVFPLLWLACHNKGEEIINYYPNGAVHTVLNDMNGDSIYIDYSPDGKQTRKYHLKNGKLNGYSRNYYPNGKIDYEVNWKDGKMNGLYKGYYETGELKELIDFIPFKDTNVARPNQTLRFSKSGDTLWNQSLYYTIKKLTAKNDTLKFGDLYAFIISLRGHPLNGTTFVYTCKCDLKYNFLPGEKSYRDTLEMTNYSIHLAWKNYKLGWNYIRGYIENTTWSPKRPSAPAKSILVYFTDSIYVIR